MSHASHIPSESLSSCPVFASFTQLSLQSATPSPSPSAATGTVGVAASQLLSHNIFPLVVFISPHTFAALVSVHTSHRLLGPPFAVLCASSSHTSLQSATPSPSPSAATGTVGVAASQLLSHNIFPLVVFVSPHTFAALVSVHVFHKSFGPPLVVLCASLTHTSLQSATPSPSVSGNTYSIVIAVTAVDCALH